MAGTTPVHQRAYPVRLLGVRHAVYVSGTADERVGAIAERQRGRVARDQLHAAGLTDRMIHGRLASGYLQRRHRSVYTVGHSAPTPLGEETAALLACGNHAVLSHCTAALLWNLIPHGDGCIHVTISVRHGSTPIGIKVHRARSLNRSEVRAYDGLPVTSPLRTLLDLAPGADLALLERAVEEAITQRLVDEAQLRSACRGRPGASRLRAILDAQQEPGITKSKAERRFRRLLRAAQLPPPLTNVRVHGYSVDAYWPALGVVIEVQGYKFHSGRRAFERDTRKGAKLTAAGLSVSYVTWLQMENEPFAVVARVAQTLALAEAQRAAA